MYHIYKLVDIFNI